MIRVLSILALLVLGGVAQAGHPVVVQRVRATPFRPFVGPVVRQRVVVAPFRQQVVVGHHAQAFVAPVHVQQFVAPVYGVQQFVAPVQAGHCQQFFTR